MVKKCEIKLTNSQNGVFLTGQTLVGSVELVLEKPKKVRSFKLEILGFAHVSWSESRSSGSGKNRSTRTVTFTGREDYICSTNILVGSFQGQQVEIPPGSHTFNFQCFLPQGLPTSFEGEFGHIRYTIKAILDRPWKFDQSTTVAFTVIRQVDLNYENPSLRIPSQMETIERFCCWPCRSAPIMLTAQIPMSGYAPGQTINITGELNNKSNVTVYAIHFKLQKTINYVSDQPSSKVKTQISEILTVATMDSIAGCTKFDVPLVIPAVAPTNITQCRVIFQTYELVVQARVSKWHRNPKITIPITIGTVPLRQLPESPFTGPEGEAQPFLFPAPAAPPLDDDWQENTDFLEIPPPTFEQCAMAGPIAIESTHENPISTNEFTPKYPVYNYGWNSNGY